ncbi:MAG: DUF423 domain-containing protein [Flavobacteriales bacterium]
MDKRALMVGSVFLFLAVALGAFGAHGLKAHVTPEGLAQWRTAVEYQFYHGLGLLLLAGMATRLPARSVRLIVIAFTLGMVLFCGSIYLLATRDVTGLQGLAPVLGPLTPLGGLCFMLGWAALFITAWRRKEER